MLSSIASKNLFAHVYVYMYLVFLLVLYLVGPRSEFKCGWLVVSGMDCWPVHYVCTLCGVIDIMSERMNEKVNRNFLASSVVWNAKLFVQYMPNSPVLVSPRTQNISQPQALFHCNLWSPWWAWQVQLYYKSPPWRRIQLRFSSHLLYCTQIEHAVSLTMISEKSPVQWWSILRSHVLLVWS